MTVRFPSAWLDGILAAAIARLQAARVRLHRRQNPVLPPPRPPEPPDWVADLIRQAVADRPSPKAWPAPPKHINRTMH